MKSKSISESKSEAPRAGVSPARVAAFEILLRVERDAAYASELLHSPGYEKLSSVDHSLATELVMGVLRWRSRLDSESAAKSAQALFKLDAEVLTALRMAVYQLRWLDRIPVRAAIHESVELVKRARKRSAASFVNAILRKIAAENMRESCESAIDSAGGISGATNHSSAETIAESSAHPLWLVQRWIDAYGVDATRKICRYDQSIPVTALRLRRPEAKQALRDEGVEFAPGAFLPYAVRISRGNITRTTAFKTDLVVIQDEASQLVAALVGRSARILDCCAAPGGKTLAIADRNAQAEIAAVELHPHRARLLQKILSDPKSGPASRRIQVIAGDARDLPLTANFGRVLADVPCSGTGTIARNPEIKWRLNPEDFADLQQRQLAILRSAMSRVSAGGRVIYSTCSLEREENEDVVERALRDDSSFRVIDCRGELDRLRDEGELIWSDVPSLIRGPFLRTVPGIHPCDGFFAAILERK